MLLDFIVSTHIASSCEEATVLKEAMRRGILVVWRLELFHRMYKVAISIVTFSY
jgi:hypothetical protein